MRTARKIFSRFVVVGLAACFVAMIIYLCLLWEGERLLQDNLKKMGNTSVLNDVHGHEDKKLYTSNDKAIPFNSIPTMVDDAFIATEDKRFYQHGAIDLESIARAVFIDLIHQKKMEGASTITQQLAKNLFLSDRKTFIRKFKEIALAFALEKKYSKNQILQMYVNRIYFGSSAYGIEAASQRYFGISNINQLTLAEIATLAGIPKSPAVFSPLLQPKQSWERRKTVLQLMYEQGYITKKQRDQADQEKIIIKK